MARDDCKGEVDFAEKMVRALREKSGGAGEIADC